MQLPILHLTYVLFGFLLFSSPTITLMLDIAPHTSYNVQLPQILHHPPSSLHQKICISFMGHMSHKDICPFGVFIIFKPHNHPDARYCTTHLLQRPTISLHQNICIAMKGHIICPYGVFAIFKPHNHPGSRYCTTHLIHRPTTSQHHNIKNFALALRDICPSFRGF